MIGEGNTFQRFSEDRRIAREGRALANVANIEAALEELRAGSLPTPLDEWRVETAPARDRDAFGPDRIPNATAPLRGLFALAQRR